MTDKVQKIREEVEIVVNRRLNLLNDDYFDLNKETDGFTNEIMDIINSLQEEPVSKVWHRGDEFKDIEYQRICKKVIGNMENKRFAIGDVMEVENGAIDLLYEDGCVAMCIRKEDTWAYLDDLLNLSNVQKIVKNWKQPVSDDLEEAANNALSNVLNAHEIVNVRSCLEMFKSGADWQKKRDYIPLSDDINEVAKQICNKVLNCEIDYKEDDVVLSDEEECVKAGIRWQMQKESIPSKDLEELINSLSKRYPEMSFAKLSRIAVRVAKWQKEHLWKPADGDDLPEIDREVIVLVKYSTQRNIHDEEYPTYRVGFGHRPNPDGWDGKNIDTNEVTHYTPKLYDKGGWNAPDIVYWLDVKLPKEIEL